MKKIILMVVGLLLTAAAGFGIYWFVFGKHKHDAPAPKPQAQLVRSYYIYIEPIGVPVFDGSTVVRHILIQMSLEVLGDANKNRLMANKKLLRSILIQAVYAYVPQAAADNRQLDLVELKRRLLGAIDHTFGPGTARNVLFQSVLDRPVW